MKIYDSSALYEMIVKGELDYEGIILDLTKYEIGSIVWKQIYRKIITEDTGREFLYVLAHWKTVLEPKYDDLDGILEISERFSLTFYDSSYVYFAKKLNMELVTYDKEIYEKANGFVKVVLVRV